MRIIVWGINYAPEVAGIGPCNTALCRHLLASGHEVEMLTSFPYYPAWARRPEDRWCWSRTDVLDGVPVHRCWHYVPRVVRRWKRIPHEASFVFTSFLRLLACRRPHLLVVVSPPLLLGAAAALLSWWWKLPYVFHVQDLQPDAAMRLGMLKPSLFTRLLYGLEAFAYHRAAAVSGISHGMIRAFHDKGVPQAKCIYFPNGIALEQWPAPGRFRRARGLSDEDFLVVYSGNLGVKQGLGILIEAARRLRGSRVRVIICGDGADRHSLARLARDVDTVTLLPLLPDEAYREMMADCDLAVIPQVAGSGHAFFPSKLLPALAAGRPVLSISDHDSELARAVFESGAGWNVEPGDAETVGRLLLELSERPVSLASRARAGRRWVEKFEAGRVLSAFSARLESLARHP